MPPTAAFFNVVTWSKYAAQMPVVLKCSYALQLSVLGLPLSPLQITVVAIACLALQNYSWEFSGHVVGV